MRKISKNTHIIGILTLLLAALLPVSALLTGCAQQEAAPVQEETSPPTVTAVPEAEDAVSEEELYAAAESFRVSAHRAENPAEVYAALENAWTAGETAVVPSGGADAPGTVACMEGDYLYVLSDRSVQILLLRNGGVYWQTSVQVGFSWYETEEENAWGGCEKVPAELYVANGRMAVVSDWIEYSNSADEAGNWVYRDLSRLCVDMYDITDAPDVRLIASYGQDGYQRAGSLAGDLLCLVSDQKLHAADCSADSPESCLPALYTGEERRVMDAADVAVAEDCRSSRCAVLCLYDLRAGVRLDAKAFVGAGDLVCADGEHVVLLGARSILAELPPYVEDVYTVTERLYRDSTDVFLFSVSQAGLSLADSVTVHGLPVSADAVQLRDGELRMLTRAESQRYAIYWDAGHGFENRREEGNTVSCALAVLKTSGEGVELTSLPEEEVRSGGFREDLAWYETADGTLTLLSLEGDVPAVLGALRAEGETAWAVRWDKNRVLALRSAPGGWSLEMYAPAAGELRQVGQCPLGHDFHTAAEAGSAGYQDRERGVVTLAAEDGCAFYVYDGVDSFVHASDVYSAGDGGFQVFRRDGRVFVADRYKVSILREDDLAWLADKYL